MPLNTPIRIQHVNVGLARPLRIGEREVQSGIVKRPADGPVEVRPLGLAGDEQADPSVHGGVSKAVYAYPVEHYPFWATVRAQSGAAEWGAALEPGSLGENLTLSGLLEGDVYVGDLLRLPDCELAVSEPRFPCFKFNAVMGFNQASKMMAANGWCGWYLAVRTPGTIAAGQQAELVPGPREVGIAELFRARMGKKNSR